MYRRRSDPARGATAARVASRRGGGGTGFARPGGALIGAALTCIALAFDVASAEAARKSAPPVAGAVSWTLSDPTRQVAAQVVGRRGQLSLEVRRAGRPVLSTPLASLPAGANVARRTSGARGAASARGTGRRGRARGAAVGVRRDRRRETFTTPAGKRRQHVLDANRLTLSFGGGRRVEVLASSDGIAYRLANLTDRTAWSAPAQSRAWLQSFRMNYEGPYQATPLKAAAAGEYGFPALLAVPGGSYALLTEAGLRYRQAASRMTVAPGRAGVLRLTLPPGEAAGTTSSWRVAVVGSLDTIVESDLPLSLGRPSEIADTSWIAPGRSAWSWWSDSWSPRRLGHQQQFVDFAAEQSFEYNVIDEGWDAAWVRDVADYGARRGVRQILWTDWHALATTEQRRTVLDRWASWGVAGIKVDFLHADTAARLAVMEDIARAAAERRMVVNFHGCTVPRGLQRTWPNVLTMEGIAGAETGKGDNATDPVLNVNAAFTRNVIGSMDYTPVTLSTHRLTSAGHELAQSVVYESGIQHYADSPESYRSWPSVAEVVRDVPAAWDDTVMVDGAPDSFVTLARRSADSWFVGSLHAGAARSATVPLRFLPAGGAYDARITGDDGRGGLAVSHRRVTAADTLEVPVGVNGGLVVTLRPAS